MNPRERFIEAVKAANIKEDDWHYDIIQGIPDPSTCTRILCEWNQVTEGEDPHDEYMQEWLEEQADDIDEDIIATSLIEWRSPDNPPEKNCACFLAFKDADGEESIDTGSYQNGTWYASLRDFVRPFELKAWAFMLNPPKL